MSSPGPKSLEWVGKFVGSLQEAIQCVWRWDVEETADPMTYLIRIDLQRGRTWQPFKKQTRALLRTWAAENECEYNRSEIRQNIFIARVYLRHLDRQKDENPFEGTDE